MSGMKDHYLGDQPFVFGGSTYSPSRDFDRLSRQAQRVAQFMERGNWVTLSEIAQATGDPEASVSARLRDMRKVGFTVDREYVANGLWRYRLKTRPEVEQPMRMAAE